MSSSPRNTPTHKRAAGKLLLTLGASALVVLGVTLAYALMPDPSYDHPLRVAVEVAVAFTVYFGITVWLFLRVKSRDQIGLLGIVSLVFLTTFFVLGFSWFYRQLENTDPGSFSEPLSKVGAVYFTIAVLSTVGFGDIRPLDDFARAAVSVQMIFGVGLLATAIGLVTSVSTHLTETPHPPTDPVATGRETGPSRSGESPDTSDPPAAPS